jgi:hypothetical protein
MRGKIILFVLLAIIVGVLYYLSAGHYSSGERAGTISKFSDRGFVFKTWEGMLNEGGYADGTGAMNRKEWDFSVSASNDSTISKLQDALRTGERITLKYEEKFFQFPWNGDSKYFVKDVLFVNHLKTAVPAPAAASTTTAVQKIDTIRKVVVIDTIRR